MFKIALHFISYLLLRSLTYPVRALSYKAIHKVGAHLGRLLFHLVPKLRKRALSNLALASELKLSTNEIETHAIEAVQTLTTTCLEYAKLCSEKKIENLVHCTNPEVAQSLLSKGQGVIFFCGHQANWEVLFLDGNSRHPGTAIGRPVKNPYLYQWLVSIREQCGGKIIAPKNALKECLRALKRGHFVGIVGDQGMPDSGFSSPFLGRPAWTSPLPALLSVRSGCPLIVATTERLEGHYRITYSQPLWPQREAPAEQEIPRLMHEALAIFEQSVKQNIGQWLWTHNRWKQQLPGALKRPFRHDTVGIILPEDPHELAHIAPYLPLFRTWYPTEVLTLFAPHTAIGNLPDVENAAIAPYHSLADLYKKDYLHKLIFNFTHEKGLNKHYRTLSAFGVYTLKDLEKIAGRPTKNDLPSTLEKALSNHAR